jgi:zinc protease
MAKLVDKGPTAVELERCLAQAESHFLFRLQTVGGFGGKSDQLNVQRVLGNPGYFEQDLNRYRHATIEVLARRPHGTKLTQRVVLSVVPKGRVALALPGSQQVVVS